MVLLDPVCLGNVLSEWALVLERVLGPEDHGRPIENYGTQDEEMTLEDEHVLSSVSCCIVVQPESVLDPPTDQSSTLTEEDDFQESSPCLTAPIRSEFAPFTNPVELIQLFSPKPLPPDLHADLSQLACLYLELGCPGRWRDGEVESVCVFLRRYFFLLDQERMRNMCTLRYSQQPDVRKSYIAGMMGKHVFTDVFFFNMWPNLHHCVKFRV